MKKKAQSSPSGTSEIKEQNRHLMDKYEAYVRKVKKNAKELASSGTNKILLELNSEEIAKGKILLELDGDEVSTIIAIGEKLAAIRRGGRKGGSNVTEARIAANQANACRPKRRRRGGTSGQR